MLCMINLIPKTFYSVKEVNCELASCCRVATLIKQNARTKHMHRL